MRWAGALVSAAVLASSSVARGGDSVAAEALFRAGREAARRGDYAAACAKFAESEAQQPAPGTLLNLADCKARVGALATAWSLYHEAYDRLDGDPRQSIAKEGMASLEPRLAHLTVRVAKDAPQGTTLLRDEVDLGSASFGVALPIDAGEHVVMVRAPGHVPSRARVVIKDGETQTVDVAIGALAPPGTEGRPASRSMSGVRLLGLALGGVGVASIGVGIATGLMTLHQKSIVDSRCKNQLCPPDGVSAASQGKTFSAVSTVTFLGGGALVVAGGVLVIASPSGASVHVAGTF